MTISPFAPALLASICHAQSRRESQQRPQYATCLPSRRRLTLRPAPLRFFQDALSPRAFFTPTTPADDTMIVAEAPISPALCARQGNDVDTQVRIQRVEASLAGVAASTPRSRHDFFRPILVAGMRFHFILHFGSRCRYFWQARCAPLLESRLALIIFRAATTNTFLRRRRHRGRRSRRASPIFDAGRSRNASDFRPRPMQIPQRPRFTRAQSAASLRSGTNTDDAA